LADEEKDLTSSIEKSVELYIVSRMEAIGSPYTQVGFTKVWCWKMEKNCEL